MPSPRQSTIFRCMRTAGGGCPIYAASRTMNREDKGEFRFASALPIRVVLCFFSLIRLEEASIPANGTIG